MNNVLKRNLRDAYDRKAQERESHGKEPWKLAERAHFLSLLRQENKRMLLEIGAATGQDATYFQEHGLEVLCIDLAPENVKMCRRKGLIAEVMDVSDMQFPPASFDAAYAMNSLLHVPKRKLSSVLRSIEGVLRPTGLLYLGVYGGRESEGVWQNDHYEPQRFFSFYTDDQLQDVVTQAFDLHTFKRIELGTGQDLHFQSCILRKREA